MSPAPAPAPGRISRLLLGLLSLSSAVAAAARMPAGGTHLELRPKFIRPCEGERDNAVTDVDVGYAFRGRTSVVVLLNLTVTRSVERWSRGRVLIEQCDTTVSASTCTPYRAFDVPEVCSMMMNPTMPWARVVADVQPKLSCPIPKGRYRLSNGTLSMELLNSVSATLRLDGYVWRFRTKALDERGDTHICVDFAGQFFRVRNRPSRS